MDRRAILRGIAVCVGGGLCVAGSILPWLSITADVGVHVTESSTGLDLSGGWVSMVAGVVILGAGAAAIASGGARWAAASAVVAAAAAVGAAVYEWVGIRRETGDIPAAISGLVDVSVGAGLLMVLAGGVLALVGGVVGFASRR